mgnify:CR=1 FL=1
MIPPLSQNGNRNMTFFLYLLAGICVGGMIKSMVNSAKQREEDRRKLLGTTHFFLA